MNKRQKVVFLIAGALLCLYVAASSIVIGGTSQRIQQLEELTTVVVYENRLIWELLGVTMGTGEEWTKRFIA